MMMVVWCSVRVPCVVRGSLLRLSGWCCCRLPVLEDSEEAEDPVNGGAAVLSRYPRWFTLAHIEAQQCDIAATMLSAAKGVHLISFLRKLLIW